jgi:hypothetical protein
MMFDNSIVEYFVDSKKVYECHCCSFKTTNKCNMIKHTTTQKHKSNTKSSFTPPLFICSHCHKQYKYKSSMLRHQSNCVLMNKTNTHPHTSNYNSNSNSNVDELATFDKPNDLSTLNIDYKELILKVLQENSKLQSIIAKQFDEQKQFNQTIVDKLEQTTITQPHHTNTPSISQPTQVINGNHNKIINIQMFLNENCKDAMSIQDFAQQIVISIDDLEKNKMECLSDVILRNLKPLAIHERPVHCLNKNLREWVFKDGKEGNWERDNGEKIITTTEFILNKSINTIFENAYPQWKENERLKEKFAKVVYNATSYLSERDTIRLLNELSKNLHLTKSMIEMIE